MVNLLSTYYLPCTVLNSLGGIFKLRKDFRSQAFYYAISQKEKEETHREVK